MIELKYIDNKSRTFYGLDNHPQGVCPKKDEIIKVTEKVKDYLLNMRNGHLPIFEEVKKPRIRKEAEEALNGSRE